MRNQLADVRLEDATINLSAVPSADGAPPQRRKRILFVSSEFSDFVKAGGLAMSPLPCPVPCWVTTISAC